jgi:hypothetical protein
MHPSRVPEIQKRLHRWSAETALASRFPLYTDYLKSLVNGERLNAVHVYLRPLIAQLLAQPHAVRHALVNGICRLLDFTAHGAGTSPVEGLPYEFLEKIALPTLLEQHRACPDDAYACVWLAMLPSPKQPNNLPEPWQLLDRALLLVPDDLFVIELRAAMHLHHIDFACHHLPDGLLNTVEGVMSEIAQMRVLAMRSPQNRQIFYLQQAHHFEVQVRDFANANPHSEGA